MTDRPLSTVTRSTVGSSGVGSAIGCRGPPRCQVGVICLTLENHSVDPSNRVNKDESITTTEDDLLSSLPALHLPPSLISDPPLRQRSRAYTPPNPLDHPKPKPKPTPTPQQPRKQTRQRNRPPRIRTTSKSTPLYYMGELTRM